MRGSIEDVSFTDERSVNPRKNWEWLRAIRAGAKQQRPDLDVGRNRSGYMEEAEFIDVRR